MSEQGPSGGEREARAWDLFVASMLQALLAREADQEKFVVVLNQVIGAADALLSARVHRFGITPQEPGASDPGSNCSTCNNLTPSTTDGLCAICFNRKEEPS